MSHLARLQFIMNARPSAHWSMQNLLGRVIVNVSYKGAWFQASAASEEEAALSILEKLEAGPGLVDAERVFPG